MVCVRACPNSQIQCYSLTQLTWNSSHFRNLVQMVNSPICMISTAFSTLLFYKGKRV